MAIVFQDSDIALDMEYARVPSSERLEALEEARDARENQPLYGHKFRGGVQL